MVKTNGDQKGEALDMYEDKDVLKDKNFIFRLKYKM